MHRTLLIEPVWNRNVTGYDSNNLTSTFNRTSLESKLKKQKQDELHT